MRRNLLLFVVIVVGTLLLTWILNEEMGYGPAPSVSYESAYGEENKIPNVVLSTIGGDKVSLYNYEGKTILLNLWASWCAPCLKELPQMIRLAGSMPNKIMLVAVSIDHKPENIEKFLQTVSANRKFPKNVIVSWDKDRNISQSVFNTVRVPETIIIAPDLTMRKKIIGADVDWNGSEMKKYLSEF